MKLLPVTLLFFMTAAFARASVYQGENSGMVSAHLTAQELDTPITVELILSINPFDVLKKHAIEISENSLDVEQSYGMILSWLRIRGFSVVETNTSCASVILSGTRGQLVSAFNTRFVRCTGAGRAVLSSVAGGGLPYRPSASLLTIQNMIILSIGRNQSDQDSLAEYSEPLRFELPTDAYISKGQ